MIPEGTNIQTVHVCFHSTPSEITSLGPIFRQAFYGLVTTPIFQHLLVENELEEIGLPCNEAIRRFSLLRKPSLVQLVDGGVSTHSVIRLYDVEE